MSRLERREGVTPAGTAEFALKGYCGTSIVAMAKRVGVTQPYLFRLVPRERASWAPAPQVERLHAAQ
ncbi:hypothetical protein [Streptomyces violarus]|uniref:hypothetical protein n=1 Tax=Streptomyces violarus TaxID=67380 RepID=UPI0037038CB1